MKIIINTPAILNVLWDAVSSWLEKNLKDQLKKKIIKLIFKTATGGFKVWLVELIVNEFYDIIGEPVVDYIINKGKYEIDYIEGKIKLKKVLQANNSQDYDDAVDDVFNSRS